MTPSVPFRSLLRSLPLSLFAAPLLSAQLVGSEPSRSPFRDVETTQHLTLSAGWMDATRDAARVGPKPGLMFTLRHDIMLGGPAWLTTRYGVLRTERRIIDPGMPAVDRDQGLHDVTHHIADMGITVALTGRKSWHGLIPTMGTGIGITSDFAGTDLGGYRFGTKFAFTFGPGVRVMLPGGYALRGDITNNVYQFQYPNTYFLAASDSTRVLDDRRQRSGWRSNWSFTTGLSVPLFR